MAPNTDSVVIGGEKMAFTAQPEAAAGGIAGILPGVLVAITVASIAAGLRHLPGVGALSPMIIGIIIGIAFNNTIGTPAWAQAGLKFCVRRLLRIGVALLGLQLTIEQVREVGAVSLAIIVTSMVGTFLFTLWMGKVLGVDAKLTRLIAGGTSICGASAVIATNAVTGASDEDVSYAIGSVTLYGSIAMIGYPLLAGLLGLDHYAFGLWAGASIHEIAQVVAAAFQNSTESGQFGTIAKLSRVILLAPMVIALGIFTARGAKARGDVAESTAALAPPWFVAGFLVLIMVNSAVTLPPSTRPMLVSGTAFLLSTALAAMGMDTDLRRLSKRGVRPAILAALAFAFISGVSLLLIKTLL